MKITRHFLELFTVTLLELPERMTLCYVYLSFDRLMIWTDWGTNPKIEKATLNGSQRVAIVTSNLYLPNGIELDRGNRRIYWVDAGVDRIESVDYNGDSRTLFKRVDGLHHFGVTLIPPFLFITDWAPGTGLHKLDAATGAYVLSSYSVSGRPMGIVAYDSSRQPSGRV